MEHVIRKIYLDLHHVYHWRRPANLKEVDLIEVGDLTMLGVVDKKMMHGVLTDRICTH